MTNDEHLKVSFTPQAIWQHYSNYVNDSDYEWVMSASTETLLKVGNNAINDEYLWEAFDHVLGGAIQEVREAEENSDDE